MELLVNLNKKYTLKLEELLSEFLYEEEVLMAKYDLKRCPNCKEYLSLQENHVHGEQ